MTDVPPEPGRSDMLAEPYLPFPTYAEWAARSNLSLDIYDRYSQLLAETRQSVDAQQLRVAVETATKFAAVDTGAIEGLYDVDRGFTFTVAAEAAQWDNIHLVKGEYVQRAIHDALAAYEYVLDSATGAKPITEVWIKELHSVICASQETYTVVTSAGPQEQPLPKGVYKTQPNNPFNLARGVIHSYASPIDTPAEMHRLVEQVTSTEFSGAHPVLQAAYAHYAFVCVHPFADGNGRVARAFASTFLYRQPGVPLVIFADMKAPYLDALEAADAGSYQPFGAFVLDRVIDTINLIRMELGKDRGPTFQERLQQMQSVLTAKTGVTHAEMDATALRLVHALGAAIAERLERDPVSPPLQANFQTAIGAGIRAVPAGYRLIEPSGNPRHVILVVSSTPPGSAQARRQYGVTVAKPATEGPEYLLLRGDGSIVMEVFFRELHPAISAALQYRIESAAEQEYLSLVGSVVERSEESLRQRGYVD